MSLDQAFRSCAVLGAGGKMGRGIAVLVLQEMSMLEANEFGSTGTGNFRLVLVDANAAGFVSLKSYLRTQLIKHAEKMIVPLRKAFLEDRSKTSNEEIVEAFVNGALDSVICSTALEDAADTDLVFEALPENAGLKAITLRKLKEISKKRQYYFSNTSSIPIWLLNQEGHLDGYIVGLHFYNPPVVQKLMEISLPDNVDETIKEYAVQISKRFGKTIVYTKDFPGFIGNGYFIREIAFASSMVTRLLPYMSIPGAIYAIDTLTRDYLVRPMGIFQLCDFVGTDVCENIATNIFGLVQDKSVLSELLIMLNKRGIHGGPGPDGTQAEGFFKYGPKSVPISVYDITSGKYVDFSDPQIQHVNQLLGSLPEGQPSWKKLSGQPNVQTIIEQYFNQLASSETLPAQLSMEYLRACHAIAAGLLAAEIASSAEDINTVMKLGFHQLYGPLESWVAPVLQEVKS